MSASSLLLLLLLLLQLSGCLPQLSRTLGSLNEITALVLSSTFEVPVSVNLLPVEVSSPVSKCRNGIYKITVTVVHNVRLGPIRQ